MLLEYKGKVTKVNVANINQLCKQTADLEDSEMVVLAFGGMDIGKVKNKLKMAYNTILFNKDYDKIVNIGDIPFNTYNYRSGRINKTIIVIKGEALKFFLQQVKWDNIEQLLLAFAFYEFNVHIPTGNKGKYDGNLRNVLTPVEEVKLEAIKSKTVVIIPTKSLTRLKICTEKIPGKYDIAVLFNDEEDIRGYCKDKFIEIAYGGKFNYSNIHNNAMECLSREYNYFIFMNDDVLIESDTLDNLLLPIAIDDNVGIVGSKLLYPDGTIQHAGVKLDKKLGALHEYRGNQNNSWDVNYYKTGGCVTFALVALSKANMGLIGLLDEKLPYDFNDIDYCIRCNSIMKQVVYNPEAVAIHEESATRKVDGKTSERDDLKYFKNKHERILR